MGMELREGSHQELFKYFWLGQLGTIVMSFKGQGTFKNQNKKLVVIVVRSINVFLSP